ncbi:tail fiber domain-containing protein [Escherichia coli]|uniref:tail fiber domain-containing protein n=1 Tax=Escherichia coli TaxID=562 RepID=UPI001F0DC745|nr:tail fiber domain-containing protein [Escherichia coli]MCH4751809.1 tail fiber domain-containing protein [Escherichia coli]
MIYTTGTIAINGNTVTGTGTDFSAPLSLIRVGCTLIAVSDPIQIFTITEIKSSTELSVTPSANPAIPAGTKFSILLSDSISVDGLAQDVAETLRYYQSKETEVAEALEWSQDHIADKIGLGDNYRDCPNISGDPSNYVGFSRIHESATGFPSVASGEWGLTGWIAQTHDDGAGIKTYSGVFVGNTTKSLYSYTYNNGSGASWAKQVKNGDFPTFEHVVLERASDLETTNGGTVRSVLKGSGGAQRTGGLFYSEIRGDNKSYTTISNHRGDKNAYAAVTEDGDFVLSNGDFIARTARLYSDVNHPLILESPFPTIRFLETDKPEGAPEFSFIVDSGNWRIEKDHYTDHPGSNCISYSHDEDAIAVPKLKADYLLPPNNLDATKVNLRIPYTGMANPVEFGAPEGAESDKYYPVIFQFPGWIGTEILAEITVSTASKMGGDYPNNNSVHLWFRNRGWSDCGTVAFGHYRAWDSNEVAINCVRTSAKNFQNYAAVYVMGSAFPVKLSATVGTNVIIPTSDFTPASSSDAPTFKWGISNTNEGLGLDEVGIIGNTLNFSSGLSGFYCSDIFRTFDGIPYASTGYNNQKWTGLQDFTTTRINSSDFSRRLKLETAETTRVNAVLSLWGSELRPSVLEYNLLNPDTEEGIGFGYYCQLNTDNSILFCVNGAVNCVTLSQSSDRDLKDNIQVIGDATEAIRKMNGYTYTLKENGLPYAGVIAQEVMEALPEAVGSFTHYGKELQGPTVDGNELREETRYLNVDYAAVTGLLVQVARETDNRVTELEEENASLRANIAEMDERIAKLEELVSKLTGSEK